MRNVKKAYEITDAKISFVSLVDKAANLRKFLITKQADGTANFTTCGRIIKTDTENHYATGIVYEPMTEDSHGNYMTEEEITKAAYWYAENGNHVDLQHNFEQLDGATVVENWVAKADFKVGDEEVRKGTWLMTVKVTDGDVWKGIENGEITGLSMGGIGNYSEEDVELENVSKQQSSEKRGLMKQIAEALGFRYVEKGAMSELFEERSKGSLFWNAMNTLEEILYSYDGITGRWRFENDEGRVREALEEFSEIITDILAGKESITKAIQDGSPVEKAGKAMSGKNRETLQGIYDNLGTFLAAFDEKTDDDDKPDETKEEPGKETKEGTEEGNGTDGGSKEKEEKEVTKQEVEQIVEAAITKAMGAGAPAAGKTPEPAPAAGAVEKSEEVTQESIDKMVEAAIAKALAPEPEEKHMTADDIEKMISAAVEKAIEPVLKSRGVPSNLNNSGGVSKSQEHYLHGIL